MAIGKVNQFKEITLCYQSNGTATLQFYTDLPTSWAARLGAGVTLASTAGVRATVTVPLDGIEGTQFYPKITPGGSTQFRLFGGHVEMKLIGIYLDGSALPQAEVWQPDPIAVGV